MFFFFGFFLLGFGSFSVSFPFLFLVLLSFALPFDLAGFRLVFLVLEEEKRLTD